jgi:putative ABC transport system substrate-binding protein
MRRREFITLFGAAAAPAAVWPIAARAQQPALPVIGYLSLNRAETVTRNMAAFHQGLAQMGYVAGRNLAIEYRWADGQNDRMSALAGELVRSQVAVIATNGFGASVAVAATRAIPVVFETGSDPVRAGLVASLNRPGGNATGTFFLSRSLETKRLELLHDMVPGAKLIAFLVNPSNPPGEADMREIEAAAAKLGVGLLVLRAGSPDEIELAFASLARNQVGALLAGSDPLFFDQRQQLADLALRHTLPAVFHERQFAEAGGLMSFGANIPDGYRLVGTYTGRILKGVKPADLPVQQATRVELIINLKTAKTLGLTVPLALLGRVDEVIE